MFVIENKQLTKHALKNILNGYSAFADTEELAVLLRKEIELLNIDIHEDITDKGRWFIPIQ